MHIGASEVQSYTRVLTAYSLLGNVNGQIQGALKAAQPDASGNLHLKDDVADISLQLDPASGVTKTFSSAVLQDVKTQDGTVVMPSGTSTHYEVAPDKTEVLRSEIPNNGNRVVTTLQISPEGGMALDGTPITADDQAAYQNVTAANGLSTLISQLMTNTAALDPSKNRIKLEDQSAKIDLILHPATRAPLSFEATYLQDVGDPQQGGLAAGTHLSFNLSPQGFPKMHSEAPAGNGQFVGQDLDITADDSLEFNQYLIAR